MARRSTQVKHKASVHILEAEREARSVGPQTKKKFSFHDLRHVTPLNNTQKSVFKNWVEQEKSLMLTGWPGTGKTFLALYAILSEFLLNREKYDKIIVVRSIVPVRDIGFLPGTEEEKTAVYESPYKQIFDELFPWKKSYDNMKEQGLVEFIPTSFVRGTTWSNSLILVDELQNLSNEELYAVMSRVGEGSRLILCGDEWQADLKRGEQSCFKLANQIVSRMPCMASVHFNDADMVVRSEFVRQFIKARQSL